MSRGFIGFNRISDEDAGYQKESADNLTPWMRRVTDQIAKQQQTVVEKAKARQSIVNEINHIMVSKPRYATVDDAVEDMQNRTGLKSYLNKIQASEKENKFKKVVAEIMTDSFEEGKFPEVLSKYDANAITTYLKNLIENGHGLSSTVPQLQHEIEHMFNIDPADVRNPEVEKFISNLILEAKSMSNLDISNPYLGKGLGQEDGEGSDFLASLMPASK